MTVRGAVRTVPTSLPPPCWSQLHLGNNAQKLAVSWKKSNKHTEEGKEEEEEEEKDVEEEEEAPAPSAGLHLLKLYPSLLAATWPSSEGETAEKPPPPCC